MKGKKMGLAAVAMLLLATPSFAVDLEADLANRAKFEKACAPMITDFGPCAGVKMGEGNRRSCVNKNIELASPQCRETIEEWKKLMMDDWNAKKQADLANRAKFNKTCAPMITGSGPCAGFKMGGGNRRKCVNKNIRQASPECRETIEEWKKLLMYYWNSRKQ